MSEIEKLKQDLHDAVQALKANQVFHTPVALSRKPDQKWDEYELDAIRRTRDSIGDYYDGTV